MSQLVVGNVNSESAKGDATAILGEVSTGKSSAAPATWLSNGLKGSCQPAHPEAHDSILHQAHSSKFSCRIDAHRRGPEEVASGAHLPGTNIRGGKRRHQLQLWERRDEDDPAGRCEGGRSIKPRQARVEIYNRPGLCASWRDPNHVSLTTTTDARTQGKTYLFRVATSEQYGYWVRGLQQMLAESQAASGASGASTSHSMAPTSRGGGPSTDV